MLPLLVKMRLTTMAMAGFSAASSPAPLPVDAITVGFAERAATPVDVVLYDQNLHVHANVTIDHQGNSDIVTTMQIRQLFHCRKTERQHVIARKTLMMLADVQEMYEGKTIEFVSVYRGNKEESATSPHRDGRAIDFRIRGVQLREIRDYLWRKYTEVGVGWYPYEQFIHMDTRPTWHDTSWTFLHGVNHYDPVWAAQARAPVVAASQARR